jgi:hypothetical protein
MRMDRHHKSDNVGDFIAFHGRSQESVGGTGSCAVHPAVADTWCQQAHSDTTRCKPHSLVS